MNTFNVKRCNERKAYEVHIKEKDHELDVAIKYAPKIESCCLEVGLNICLSLG